MERMHLQKLKPSKYSVMKFDFKFSQIQVSKVPVGYDKLVVSIISVDSNKTMVRTAKALVRNGRSQWPEVSTVTVKFLHDVLTKEFERRLFKFAVSMGTVRASVLGEATVNLVDYLNSNSPASVCLPLEKCSQGTMIQVTIQCLNTSILSRETEQGKEGAREHDEKDSISDDIDNRSEGSDHMLAGSFGSSSGSNSSSHLHQKKNGAGSLTDIHDSSSTGTMTPAEGNNNHKRGNFLSFDNSYSKKEDDSETTITNSPQDSMLSSSGSPLSAMHTGTFLRQSHDIHCKDSSADTDDFNRVMHFGHSENQDDESKSISESTDTRIQELHKEAMEWERRAQNLVAEAEVLKYQVSGLTKENSNLKMEFSAKTAECDSLKGELEQLTTILQASKEYETSLYKARIEADDAKRLIRELQEQVELQKQSNANQDMQLRKTQDSNAEFLSVLRAVEETVEQKNAEISKLQDELGVEKELSKQMKSELQKTHEAHSQLFHYGKKLEEEIMEHEREIKHLSSINDALTHELEAAKGEYKSTISHMDEIRGKNKELVKCLKETEHKLSETMKEMGSYKDKACLLQSRLDNVLKQIADSTMNEHGSKVDMLNRELNACRLKEEEMNSTLANTLRQLENMKSSEESYRERIDNLETTIALVRSQNEKLEYNQNVFDNHKQELKDLRHQFTILQDKHEEIQIEKARLESSLSIRKSDLVHTLYEKVTLLEQLELIETHFLDGEEIKNAKAALEKKIHFLEQKGNVKIESAMHHAEQKSETEMLKKFNDQFQSKLQHLKGEREEFRKKIILLENQLQSKPVGLSEYEQKYSSSSGKQASSCDSQEKQRSDHLQMNRGDGLLEKEVENLKKTNEEQNDLLAKIVTLEMQLEEANETNTMYKSQLQTFLSQDQSVLLASIQRYGTVEQVLEDLLHYQRTIPSLKEELDDMHQRYSQLAVQYAETAAERDELLLSVRNSKKGRKWF